MSSQTATQLSLYDSGGYWENFSRDYVVTKSNKLIEAIHDLDTHEQKIIEIIMSLINPLEDTTLKQYKIRAKDLAEFLNVTDNNFYARLRELINGLQKKTVTMRQADDVEIVYNWVITSKYYTRQGDIEIQIHPDLTYYLVQMKNNFTSYKVGYVIDLSNYSSKIYQLFKSYHSRGENKKRFTVEEFKRILAIPEGKWELYGHLKKKIIMKAKSDLEETTDIRFELEEKKEGRKVAVLVFHLFPNKKKKGISSPITLPPADTFDNLLELGINEEKVKELHATYSPNRILQNITYSLNMVNSGDSEINNFSGYVISAIENNYAGVSDEEDPSEIIVEETDSDESSDYIDVPYSVIEDDEKVDSVDGEDAFFQGAIPFGHDEVSPTFFQENERIKEMNSKLQDSVDFYNWRVENKKIKPTEGLTDLYQNIMAEIDKYENERESNGFRALQKNDLDNEFSQQAFDLYVGIKRTQQKQGS